MATIHHEFPVEATPEKAWEVLRDVSKLNQLISFLGEVTVEGDQRTCSVGDGGTLSELIVSVDEERRRVAYSITESPFNMTHHHASMQVKPNGGTGSTFIWTSDLKPDSAAPGFSEVLDTAVESIKQALR
jgi:carbon monoxide dehydrogenase subunit G